MSPSVRRRFVLALALALVVAAAPARARESVPDAAKPYWRRNIFKRIGGDQGYLFRVWLPREVSRPGFSVPLFTSTAIAVTGSIGDVSPGIDGALESAIYSQASPGGTSVAHAFTGIGNPPVVLAVLGLTYLGGRVGHDDRLAETSSLAVEAFADAGLWNVILKEVAARVRPGEPNEGRFLQYGSAQNQSFPSGHAMIAFSVAAVFEEQYRDARWVGGLAYGTASMIALSRVALGRHFPADVVAGGVLGASFGHMVVNRARESRGERVAQRAWLQELQPFYDPVRGGYGLGWSRRW